MDGSIFEIEGVKKKGAKEGPDVKGNDVQNVNTAHVHCILDLGGLSTKPFILC